MAKPRKGDAAEWKETFLFGNFEFVRIFEPTAIVDDVEPLHEKRFSYVSADVALRNWLRVVVPGERDKYFYGEMAVGDARRYAQDKERELFFQKEDY